MKKIHLTPVQFTIENNSLTPTLKVKRHEARKMYDEVIKKMYAEPLPEEQKSPQKPEAKSPAKTEKK